MSTSALHRGMIDKPTHTSAYILIIKKKENKAND